MADWIVCPGCQLRHSRRADGLCPRCKQSVDGTPENAEAGAPPLPSSPPPLSSLAPGSGGATAGLGRLAQSARGKELKNARIIMILVGLLTVAVNGFFFSSAESNVQQEIDKEIAKLPAGFVADPVKVAVIKSQAVRAVRLVNLGGLFLGVLFLVCAALVEKHPVPITITSLALYLGGVAIFGMLDPSTIASGLLIKIVIVIGLFKAVQAAIAYQKEMAAVPGA